MGFLSDFFGGGKSETKVAKEEIYTPEQMALLKQMAGQFQTGMGGPVPSAPQMATPTTGAEQQYLDFISGLGEGRAMQQLTTGEVPYEVGPQWAEKYFEEGIRPAMLREYEQVAKPALQEAFAGPSYHGTARMRAETEQAGDLASQLATMRTQLMYGEELEKRKATESAYGRVLPATELLGGAYGAAGGLERGIAQEKTMADLQRFLMGEEVDGAYNPAYNPNVALAMQLLGMSPYQIGTTTEETGPGLGHGLLTGAAPGVGMGLGALIAGSDRALKKDIVYLEPIGKIKPVLFRYKQEYIQDNNRLHVGVIAQDLLEVLPKLVHKIVVKGKEFLGVDYAGLNACLRRLTWLTT